MCSNYPGIKLEPALGTLQEKIEYVSSYAHVVHTTAKQVISRRRKNENVYKMSKNEKCTCKACKNTVFHCQLCKFVGFLLPASSWLLKLPIREFKKLRRQLQRKRHIKIELYVKLSLFGLFHVDDVVQNRRTALSLASCEWFSCKGKE